MTSSNSVVDFSTVHSILKDSTGAQRSVYRGVVRHRDTVRGPELVASAAANNDIKESLLAYHCNVLVGELKAAILHGNRIELDDFMSIWLTATGTFESANAKWDTSANRVNVHCAAKGTFRDSVSGLTGRNVTEGNHAMVRRVLDTVSKIEGQITSGVAGMTVKVSGDNLLVTTGAPDEGVWLEKSDGTIVATGTVVASTQTTLDCTFDALPEDGAYRFCVAARGGLSMEYGVSKAFRNVTVKSAESGDESEEG